MDISEITTREFKVLEIISAAKGTMEQKLKELSLKGVLAEYDSIFLEYVKIHKQDAEALLRGIFLYWYSTCEPSCYTGLGELDDEQFKKLLATLNAKLANGVLDYEMNWMLSYYSNWDYVFSKFIEFKWVQKFINDKNKIELPAVIDQEAMKKRGQMGKYWNTIIK